MFGETRSIADKLSTEKKAILTSTYGGAGKYYVTRYGITSNTFSHTSAADIGLSEEIRTYNEEVGYVVFKTAVNYLK